MDSDIYMAVITLCFILGDLVSGFVKAVYNNEVSSTKLREGLYHKLGFIGALIMGYGCQLIVKCGFMPECFNVVFAGVAVFICWLEAVSITENLCAVSPELADSPLAQFLQSNEQAKLDKPLEEESED